MNDFYKFKRKLQKEAYNKSSIIGLTIGLLSFSIPLLICIINKIDYNLIILCVIALIIQFIISGLLFLVFRPTKLKIAKRLDNHFNLNQKVQTMVEFEDKDNFMVSLQREDTLNILSNISLKQLPLKIGLFCYVFLGIAFATCVTAVAISVSSNEPETEIPTIIEDPTYELDDWTVQALKDIIKVVKDSTVIDSLKNKYISELERLLEALETTDKDSQMKALVQEVIANIKLELDKVNTNNEFFTVLKDSDNNLVVTLANEINHLNVEKVTNTIDNFIILISGNASAITELDPSFGELLRKSNLNKEDDLYQALIKFADEINECTNAENVNDAVISVVQSNSSKIVSAVEQQFENKFIADYIEVELSLIFNLYEKSEDEDGDTEGSDSEGNSGEDGDDKENEGNNSGGLGTGEIIFGSNDQIFDPEKGSVEYGEVITKYYGQILGKFGEGDIPDELRAFFDYYYDILFGDFEIE